MPSEFAPLVSAHQTVGKLSVPLKATISSANQEYEKQTDASTPVPSAPVYAARLNGLLKTLANAESAVAECVKAREGLILGLEKLLDTHRAALEQDKASASQLQSRKTEIEEKKQQVEVAIMRALGPADNDGSPAEAGSGSPDSEPDRPQMEALTPPMEAFTPPMEALTPEEERFGLASDGPINETTAENQASTSGIEMLSNVASSYQSLPISTNGSNKRRRVDDANEFPDLGGDDDIDADVAAMLKDGGES